MKPKFAMSKFLYILSTGSFSCWWTLWRQHRHKASCIDRDMREVCKPLDVDTDMREVCEPLDVDTDMREVCKPSHIDTYAREVKPVLTWMRVLVGSIQTWGKSNWCRHEHKPLCIVPSSSGFSALLAGSMPAVPSAMEGALWLAAPSLIQLPLCPCQCVRAGTPVDPWELDFPDALYQDGCERCQLRHQHAKPRADARDIDP